MQLSRSKFLLRVIGRIQIKEFNQIWHFSMGSHIDQLTADNDYLRRKLFEENPEIDAAVIAEIETRGRLNNEEAEGDSKMSKIKDLTEACIEKDQTIASMEEAALKSSLEIKKFRSAVNDRDNKISFLESEIKMLKASREYQESCNKCKLSIKTVAELTSKASADKAKISEFEKKLNMHNNLAHSLKRQRDALEADLVESNSWRKKLEAHYKAQLAQKENEILNLKELAEISTPSGRRGQVTSRPDKKLKGDDSFLDSP